MDEYGALVHYIYNSTLIKIDLEDGYAQARKVTSLSEEHEDPTEINFMHIIGADGVSRNAFNRINNNLKEKSYPSIEIESTKDQALPNNVSAYLIVYREDNQKIELTNISERAER